MSSRPICSWPGETGEKYEYYVSSRAEAEDWASGTKGNYILAKRAPQPNRWTAVYVGQGDLGDRASAHADNHCINSNSATHFHWHTRNHSSLDNRLAEETDIADATIPPCKGKSRS